MPVEFKDYYKTLGVERTASHDEIRKAFADTSQMLRRRIELLASLPLDKLDRIALQNSVREIAKT